jgi:hypothetical protein
MNSSVFVSIPSFRDVEAQHTIACLFENARHPERVFVGVFHQIKPDDPINRVGYSRPDQVRVEGRKGEERF